jgi:Ca2+-binding EF-hand superfamily protein
VCEDLLNWGQKVATNSKVEFTDERRGEWGQMHTIFFKGKAMKLDEWCEYVALFIQNNPTYFELSVEINKALCNSFANKDGKIGYNEYFAFVSPLGVSEEDTKATFKLLDTEGTGSLSIEEFADAVVHYYFDANESKYMHLFGEFPTQIAVSAFQRKKLERVFAMTDHDHSGHVTVDDFILWGEKAATVSKVEFTDERKAEWVNAHLAYFAGKNMVIEEFVEHVENSCNRTLCMSSIPRTSI